MKKSVNHLSQCIDWSSLFLALSSMIVMKAFLLSAHPCNWQTYCQVHIRLIQITHIQFSCNPHQCENIKILVYSLINNEFFVSFTYMIILPVIFKSITRKNRFCIVGRYSGRRYSIGRLDVAVPCIHADHRDVLISQINHTFPSSIVCRLVKRSPLPSVQRAQSAATRRDKLGEISAGRTGPRIDARHMARLPYRPATFHGTVVPTFAGDNRADSRHILFGKLLNVPQYNHLLQTGYKKTTQETLSGSVYDIHFLLPLTFLIQRLTSEHMPSASR